MKGLQVEAVYQNGTLKLARQLSIAEGQTVTITVHPPGGVVERSYGLVRSSLNLEELERAALDPLLGLQESP